MVPVWTNISAGSTGPQGRPHTDTVRPHYLPALARACTGFLPRGDGVGGCGGPGRAGRVAGQTDRHTSVMNVRPVTVRRDETPRCFMPPSASLSHWHETLASLDHGQPWAAMGPASLVMELSWNH